jgi:cytoskeletal protein CcmA (bactofilin family)
MFRRKREDKNEMKPEISADDAAMGDAQSSPKPLQRPMAPAGPVPPAGAAFAKPTAPLLGRGGVSWAQQTARPASSGESPGESKKLIVGRDIVLSGQITSCERLIVEGRVEASLSDSRVIEIAETGHFKGTAEIESADIAGRFEGTLSVRERLFIRSTGKLSGKITYGQIEIEPGGEISGEVHVGPRRAAPATSAPAAEPEPAYGTASGS